jgi:hypothetical protein
MGTRDRKARLAILEKAHAPTAGLSYMQAQITNSKTSMSAIALISTVEKEYDSDVLPVKAEVDSPIFEG